MIKGEKKLDYIYIYIYIYILTHVETKLSPTYLISKSSCLNNLFS